MAESCGFCFSWPVLVVLGYFFLDILIRTKNYLTRFKSNQTKHILITGCDSGFGHKTALKLSCNNHFILAGCLTKEGVHRLQVDTSFMGKAFLMDVTNENDIENVVSIVEAETKDQGMFVCLFVVVICFIKIRSNFLKEIFICIIFFSFFFLILIPLPPPPFEILSVFCMYFIFRLNFFKTSLANQIACEQNLSTSIYTYFKRYNLISSITDFIPKNEEEK